MIRWFPARPLHPGCPHRRLTRLLAAELPAGVALGASTLRPWASANFVGARHIFSCTAPAEPASGLLQEKLAAIEWPLHGHIVADITVEPAHADGSLRIEILTVED